MVLAGAVCVLVGYVIHRDPRMEVRGGRMMAIGAFVTLGFAFGLIVVLLLAVRPLQP